MDQDDIFQIAPFDVEIFFDTPKQIKMYCVPPSQSEFVVTWWKGDKRLNTVASSSSPNKKITDDRIKISEKSDRETTELLGVTPGSKVSELRFHNILPSDQGEYSCTASNKSGHFAAKFNVTITGEK